MADTYDAKANGIGCYAEAIAAKRAKLLHERCPAAKRVVVIGNCELYQGDALTIVKHIGSVDHAIFDPPYEQSLHDSKNSLRGPARVDSGPDLKGLDFAGIDEIRSDVVVNVGSICTGWFIAFCTIEGVWQWATAINASRLKYKRACIWWKPDSTPQLNGQGPAQGAECFVCAWAGRGHAKWNAGGKRGIYRHLTNPSDRHGCHPTEKPWRLFSDILTDFTSSGETILDPFMGSGTTGVACVKLGRRFIGIELDPGYFDITCERIRKAYAQPDMFVEQPKAEPPKQGDLLDDQ
jgi:site-specific DNA-methyltransferase (adenine-specific)